MVPASLNLPKQNLCFEAELVLRAQNLKLEELQLTSRKSQFYSSLEVDELIQKLQANLYVKGNFFYTSPDKDLRNAYQFRVGIWEYNEVYHKSLNFLEDCLSSLLEPEDMSKFTYSLLDYLVEDLDSRDIGWARFNDLKNIVLQNNLLGLKDPEEKHPQIELKAMKAAYLLVTRGTNNPEIIEKFTFLTMCSFLGLLKRQFSEIDPKVLFINDNTIALLSGMKKLRENYAPMINDFMSEISEVTNRLESTLRSVSDPSRENTIDDDHLAVLNAGEFFRMVKDHCEIDLNQFARQREVMADVYFAMRRYQDNKVGCFPYLSGNGELLLQKRNPADERFIVFLQSYYDVVDYIYGSHMIYLRKAINAAVDARSITDEVLARYDKLLSPTD